MSMSSIQGCTCSVFQKDLLGIGLECPFNATDMHGSSMYGLNRAFVFKTRDKYIHVGSTPASLLSTVLKTNARPSPVSNHIHIGG